MSKVHTLTLTKSLNVNAKPVWSCEVVLPNGEEHSWTFENQTQAKLIPVGIAAGLERSWPGHRWIIQEVDNA